MRTKGSFYIDFKLIACLLIMLLISLISIYSADTINGAVSGVALKQLMWISIGSIIIVATLRIRNNFIYKHIHVFYILGNVSLISLLLFTEPINNARCWFKISGIGTIQPSEFMKIILIIGLAKIVSGHKNRNIISAKTEVKLLLKVIGYTLVPAILTFLQPDTGAVIMYIIISIVILFIAGIRMRWFVGFGLVILLIIVITLSLYFFNRELFVKLLGTDFFLRVERLTNWAKTDGLQLVNGMTAIGSAGFLGVGINKTPIYFPEAHTDFIFAVFASNTGFLGSVILLITIALFDIQIINIGIKSKDNMDKVITAGIVGVLLYQQLQNIGMTFGLLPITGITLPFISYGGSSLISYMLMVGLVLNIHNKNEKYSN